MLDRIRFRRWWQLPRPASDHPEERRVTFLEVFYDLVYVVIRGSSDVNVGIPGTLIQIQ